ncbi:autophagy protein 13 [Ascosphaera pollenicola]|nr:autophagy protein 13 [Ascosphaera pollenicola]
MKSSISSFSRTASSFFRASPTLRQTVHIQNKTSSSIFAQCLRRSQQRRGVKQLADDPNWSSPVDNPPQLIRTGQRHGYGIIFLGIVAPSPVMRMYMSDFWCIAIIPVTAFCLGTWQIQRLDWKTKLISKFEDRLLRPPLTLPPVINPSVVSEFDYRKVLATGQFRHDQEMLVGPRMYEGEQGYLVVTPLERGEGQSTVLVSRGWIAKEKADQSTRKDVLPTGEVTVEGLLREPPKKNMFTPHNIPEENKWYFMDISEMAQCTGAQPIYIEETFIPDLMAVMDRQDKGIPIGRVPEVALRNNHVQYIVTWYGLCFATTIMLGMVLRKKPTGQASQRVRLNTRW